MFSLVGERSHSLVEHSILPLVEASISVIVNCRVFTRDMASKESFRSFVSPVDLFVRINHLGKILLPTLSIHHKPIDESEFVSLVAAFECLIQIWRIREHRCSSYNLVEVSGKINYILFRGVAYRTVRSLH